MRPVSWATEFWSVSPWQLQSEEAKAAWPSGNQGAERGVGLGGRHGSHEADERYGEHESRGEKLHGVLFQNVWVWVGDEGN